MDDDSLDLREYADICLSWWWIFALVPLLAAASVAYSLAWIPAGPSVYEATATLAREGNIGVYNAPELVNSTPVLAQARDNLGLEFSLDTMRAVITAEAIPNTQLLEIKARHGDPVIAAAIANNVSERLVEHLDMLQESRLAAVLQNIETQLAVLGTVTDPEGVREISQRFGSSISSSVGSVSLIGQAEVPTRPIPVATSVLSQSHVGLAGIIGALLGVVAAGLIVYILEIASNSVRFPGRIEHLFGLAPIGEIPAGTPKLWKRSNEKPGGAKGQAAAEAVQCVATCVDYTIQANEIKSILVASANSRNGRSSLTAEIATAMAKGWKSVVLVDADLRCPSLHQYFELDNSRGLSSYLSNSDLGAADVVQQTTFAKLKVVTSGPLPADPVELIKSPRMAHLLQELQETADIVIVDGPPAALTADASVLAGSVGGVVLLVDGSGTTMNALKEAMRSLRWPGTPILGFIWNQPSSPFQWFSREARSLRKRFSSEGSGETQAPAATTVA